MTAPRVLLVDDEAIFTRNMTRLLSRRGFEVMAAGGGEEALSMLAGGRFDVVVLDLKMPGMDGLATLREIKKRGLFAPTLILTGHGSIDTALEAVKLGAYDYLVKPCTVDELMVKIEAVMRQAPGATLG